MNEDKPPPLPKRPPTVIRSAPPTPVAETANQNGSKAPPALPARPVPPRPTAKVPPRPTSPTQANTKDLSKEMKSHSSTGKTSSSNSTKRKLEITVVDARPMSEIGFRDFKKSPSPIAASLSSNPSSSTSTPGDKSEAPNATVKDGERQDATSLQPPPPSAPPRPTPGAQQSVDRQGDSDISEGKPSAAMTDDSVTTSKPKRPTIIRPQSKLLKQQAMTSMNDVDEGTKSPPPQPLPPLPSVPPNTAAHKSPPLPPRTPVAHAPKSPLPVSRPPLPKSDPKSNPAPMSRPPPPKPTTPPVSRPPLSKTDLKSSTTTTTDTKTTPTQSTTSPPTPRAHPPPMSRPPPPKKDALSQQQQQQQEQSSPPKAAPRPKPRPRSTVFPSSTNIVPIPEATAATTESISLTNKSSLELKHATDNEVKPHFQDMSSTTKKPERPAKISRPQSMILLPSDKKSNNDSLTSSSHDLISSSSSSPSVPVRPHRSPKERPSRPSAPPVQENFTPSSAALDNETENVYETIEEVHHNQPELKSKLDNKSIKDRPLLPPPRKEVEKKSPSPTFISYIKSDTESIEDTIPEYSQINKTKSNISKNNNSILTDINSESGNSKLESASVSIETKEKARKTEEEGEKETTPPPLPKAPILKPKPKPGIKPKPKPSIKAIKPSPKSTHPKTETIEHKEGEMEAPVKSAEGSSEQSVASDFGHGSVVKVEDKSVDSSVPHRISSSFLSKFEPEKKDSDFNARGTEHPREQSEGSFAIQMKAATHADKFNAQKPAEQKSLQENDPVSSLESFKLVSADNNSDMSEQIAKVALPSKRPTIIGRPSLEKQSTNANESQKGQENVNKEEVNKDYSENLSLNKNLLSEDLDKQMTPGKEKELDDRTDTLDHIAHVRPPPKRPLTMIGRPIKNEEKVTHVSSSMTSEDAGPEQSATESVKTKSQPPKRPPAVVGRPSGEKTDVPPKEITKSHSLDDTSHSQQTSFNEDTQSNTSPPKRPVTIIGMPKRSSHMADDSLDEGVDSNDNQDGDDKSSVTGNLSSSGIEHQSISTNENSLHPKPSRPPQAVRPPPPPPPSIPRSAPVSKSPLSETKTMPIKSENVNNEKDTMSKLTESSSDSIVEEKDKVVHHRLPPPRPSGNPRSPLPASPLEQLEDVVGNQDESAVEGKEKTVQHRPPPPRPSGGPVSPPQSLPPTTSLKDHDDAPDNRDLPNVEGNAQVFQHRPPPPRPSGGPASQASTAAPLTSPKDHDDVSNNEDITTVEESEKAVHHRPPPPRPSGGPASQVQSSPSTSPKAHDGDTSGDQVLSATHRDEGKDDNIAEEDQAKRPPVTRPTRPPSYAPRQQTTPDSVDLPEKDHQTPDAGSPPERPKPPRPISAAPAATHKPSGPPSLPPRPAPGHPLYHYLANEPHAIASHDYNASQSDELSFQVGDVILITREVDEDWLSGKLGEEEGIFPRAFVNLKYETAQESGGPDLMDDVMDATNEKPDNLTGPRCRARFDFEGEGEGELAIEDGDVIRLINHVGSEWMRGELDGSVGIFPSAFVEIIEDIRIESGEEMADSQVIEAMFDFDGQEGELSFQAGDIIDVRSQVSSEWVFGECGGRTGKFPATFVSHLPPSLPQYKETTEEEIEKVSENVHTEEKAVGRLEAGVTGEKLVLAFCTAIHDYNSGTGGDLEFKSGDRIEILEFVGEDWIEGRLNGDQGLFPVTFVAMEEEKADKFQTSSKEEAVIKQAKALHDFEGETDEDLSFKAGDVIELLDFVDTSQEWRWGISQGKKGIFPSVFVEDC